MTGRQQAGGLALWAAEGCVARTARSPRLTCYDGGPQGVKIQETRQLESALQFQHTKKGFAPLHAGRATF